MNEFYDSVKGLMFKDIDDLYLKKIAIREKYALLDYPTKEIYKWYYYYQLCLLKNPLKRLMWEFINGSNELSVQCDLCLEYRKFCKKRNRLYPQIEKEKIIESPTTYDNDFWGF